jgi:hypothetical protein
MSYEGANWTPMNCKTKKHGLYNKVELPKLIKALERAHKCHEVHLWEITNTKHTNHNSFPLSNPQKP